MKPIWIFIFLFFFSGLYVTLNYSSKSVMEGFQPSCPNVLIQDGNELLLKNTKLADVPGINPIIFHNLDEYTEFFKWQQSRGLKCPLLYLEKSYSTQNEPTYKVKPIPKEIIDATKNDPYNKNSYPGVDNTNQDIGEYTTLDQYHDMEESQPLSKNPMDSNWGGNAYTNDAIKRGEYRKNEVRK